MVNMLKKLLGITTLSCSERSIKFRPEHPWRARNYTIVPEWSMQYWTFFASCSCCQACFPSTVKSSVKNVGIDSEDFLSFSNYTCCEWRRRYVTSLRYLMIGERSIFLVQSMSVQFFLPMVKSWQVHCLCVFLLPLIGMQILLHSVLTHILRAHLLEFLLLSWSNSSLIYLMHEKISPKSDYCLFKDKISDINSICTVQITGCNF